MDYVVLSDVCEKIGSGATPRGGSDVYLSKGEISLIRSQNIYNDGFKKNGLAFITDIHAKELDNVKVESGDILLNITGDSVARCCQVPDKFIPARVNQHVAIIRPHKDFLDARYLRYYLICPLMQDHMLTLASGGATRNALTKGMIESFEIPAPPLPKQRAIAGILGSLDDKIELNQSMNATLEAMARAVFREWFVDGEEVGEWEESRLGDVITNYDSKRVPLANRERAIRQGKYPYYGAASIMDYIDDYLFDGIYVLMAEDGSVIGDNDHPVIQYVWGKFWVNNHAHVLRGINGICNEHLYLFLKELNILPYVTGAVQPKLNQGNMNSIPFVLPPKELSKRFEEFITPLFAKIRINTDESRTLASLRDSLLPRLMNGDVMAKDVEKEL